MIWASGESAIAASGTAVYSIPLSISFLQHINLKTIDRDILINVYPNTNPVSAGTGSLVLSKIRLRFSTRVSPISDQQSVNVIRSNIYRVPYMDTRLTTHSVTLTASQISEIPM